MTVNRIMDVLHCDNERYERQTTDARAEQQERVHPDVLGHVDIPSNGISIEQGMLFARARQLHSITCRASSWANVSMKAA